MKTQIKNKSWIAGTAAALAASLCCIVPVIAFIGGLSGIALSINWMEQYRPYLIGSTIMIFGFAWYQKLRPKQKDDCCEPRRSGSFLQSTMFLGIMTVISGVLIAFPYYANLLYTQPVNPTQMNTTAKNNLQEVQADIQGMTCEACTLNVNAALSKVNGVIAYKTSYPASKSTIKFDKSKTATDSIIKAINSTGYTVTGITPK